MSELTHEQREVVETWGQGIAVMAGAGSGKTHTLRAKVRALLESDREARFAAVSFTEKSANDLHEKLTALCLEVQGRPLLGHVVTTIHGLCSSIIREYPQEAGFDGDERMLNESQSTALWTRALDQLWFDELPETVDAALPKVLEKHDRPRLNAILTRLKNLQSVDPADALADESLAVLYRYCWERYDRLKRKQGALDFDDLERGAHRALQFEHVREEYHVRFALVMVDEFQDTNPLQAEILLMLGRPGLTNVCVVGDPKQAIYRFRGADVSVFDEFCSRPELKRVKLTQNFRSRPGILDFCNSVCAPLFAASGLEYDALVPAREAATDVPAVIGVSVYEPSEFAAWLLAEQGRGMRLDEVALLLRKIRGGSEKWLRALMQAGIPIAIESGGLLWKDPRPREIVMLLRWWSNPQNEMSAVGFMRAPWVAVADAELDLWRETDRSFVTSFFASANPVAEILRPLWERREAVRPGEVLAQLLYVPGIEDELGSSLLSLWHRVEELSLAGRSFKEVVAELSSAMSEERREKSVPPPKNEGQLRVLTIHGSKGLEFPHVVLLDFPEKASRRPNMPMLLWDRQNGIFLPERDEEDEVIKDVIYETWRNDELLGDLAETKRVFYVALTRAEERLVLVLPTTPPAPVEEVPEGAKPKKAALKKPLAPAELDFWRKWIEPAMVERPIVKAEKLRRLPLREGESIPVAPFVLPTEKPAFAARRPRHSVSEWNLLAKCPRQFQWKVIDQRPPDDESTSAGDWIVGEEPRESRPARTVAQSEIGTRVHRSLELGDDQGLRELETELGADFFRAEPVIEWMNRSPQMIDDGEGRAVYKEFAFEIPIEDEALVGAMDRLVVDTEPEEKFAIVDFKVTSRWKDPAVMRAEYTTQLNLYAWSLWKLEPDSTLANTTATLIQISADRVEEIEVRLEPSRLENFKRQASEIVQGTPGLPTPGKVCRHCDFNQQCDVAVR